MSSAALRQRAVCAARQVRPTGVRNTRSYASESHGSHGHGHHAPPVEESLGTAFYVAVGAVPACMLLYSVSRPGKDGEPSGISKMLERVSDMKEQWETRNHLMTAALEQAAHDKHLLYHAPRNTHVELKYPEVFQHGSPFNVPAGHYINMDKVVAHYRKQHLEEEERKAKKLGAHWYFKAPDKFLKNAPEDAPAVRVGLVSSAIGYGLFAARDFRKDDFIFHEAPFMQAIFNEKDSANKENLQTQHHAFKAAVASEDDSAALRIAFPRLAGQTGHAPVSFDDAAFDKLGKNLVHGQFAGSTVSREEYDRYISGLKVASNVKPSEVRQAVLDFFKHYAFQVRHGLGVNTPSASFSASSTSIATSPAAAAVGSQSVEACIYLLGSLINHCCSSSKDTDRGPNCYWRIGPQWLAHFVRPKHLCVQAKRDIKAGEQLTWDYGKRNKGFTCECDACNKSLKHYMESLCRVQ
ncbi:hypothetical protein QBC46DRAFT_357435 [Diplogelasinospora grovesii]|uniref:SET domain-containing protein n=1 Tax=Diplogelasinospora grovesii TaxID=303347 RepID=A0AAN6S105_9PEZI|nr:hypothetical protein QBC46DRAFT_357435 [Diplogelasinospora grovesii]